MRNNLSNVYLLLIGILILALANCSTLNMGQKPILTMQDIKALSPTDLADFSISLYNKQADWYRDQMTRVDTFNQEQCEQLVKDYERLVTAWPFINLYDELIAAGQPINDSLRLKLYRFIEQYLGGN